MYYYNHVQSNLNRPIIDQPHPLLVLKKMVNRVFEEVYYSQFESTWYTVLYIIRILSLSNLRYDFGSLSFKVPKDSKPQIFHPGKQIEDLSGETQV